MKRRRLIAIISLCTLAVLGVLTAIAGMVVMRTDIARNFVQARLSAAVNGRVYVGRISGNPLVGLTVDTIAIRDRTGELVISSGRVSVAYDIRDLIDQRIYLRHVIAEHPLVHLRQQDSSWNYKRLFKSGGPKPKVKASTWGDFIVVDSVRVTDATYLLSLHWTPDSSLTARQRDSVVRHELTRTDRKVERTPDGFARTYMWTRANGLIEHARLADPDSNRFGRDIRIAWLNANEFDPPFLFRNVRGRVRHLGDSAWLNIAHWDLPGSTGSASGKLVWGSGRPMRYDLVVRGDSVSLVDVNWVYPTLPKSGGGRMLLRISNKRNDRLMDYHIDSMDVRSTRSRLIGEMTFGVGAPVLQLRNVNLKMQPVDFDLIRTLNGKSFPIDWQGQIFGDVRAPGGPLDEFAVATANGEWRDTHVPGAVSRLSGSGNLDIQFPAFTAFHDFDLDVKSLDLRSIEYLFPAFPKLQGTIAGTATLDSVWTDVRFSNADVVHRDGPGTPSHFTGNGRITDGSPFITYDVDLNADPISFDMLARSFPKLTLRGLAYGPVKIQGQSPDLQVVTNLVSAAGALRFAGNIDIDSLGGYGARGVGEITNVNLARLGIKENAATTSLTGRYSLDVRGSTPATLTGKASIELSRSTYDRVTLDTASRATIQFDRGRAITSDTLVINSPIGRVSAFGALGLPGGGSDSVHVTLVLDTLGGLRPYFTSAGEPARRDTLGGKVTVNGYASGRLDSLFLSGTVDADSLNVRGLVASRLSGTFAFADVLRNPSGLLDATAGSLKVGGLQFDTVRTQLRMFDTTRAQFAVDGRNYFGDSLSLAALGGWTRASGLLSAHLDTFALAFGESRWRLDQPATLQSDSSMFRLDTISLRSARGASIGLAGSVPNHGAVDLRLSASAVPLFDVNRVIGQTAAPVSGFADLSTRATGTKDMPVIEARTTLDSIAISGVGIGRLIGNARYANNLATANADIFQQDSAGTPGSGRLTRRVLHAVADSLPLSIRLFGVDTLPGRVLANAVADSAAFTLIQAWVDLVSGVTGKVSGNASIDGTWRNPNLLANVALTNGGMRVDTLGIALSKMYGRLSYRNDTLSVDTLSANSGGDRNTAGVAGTIVFKGWDSTRFDVRMSMHDFLAYDRAELATIYARTDSGPIRLSGTPVRDTLTGVVNVNQGSIYLPDEKMIGKRFSVFDSTLFFSGQAEKTLFQRLTDSLYTNLLAHIGGSFNLSAAYADIPLTGDLRIVPVATTDVAQLSGDYISRLAPVGTIYADRGTYTLDRFPIKKDFDVQRGGTITFDRDAQWNGEMKVSARTVIRKPGRPEVPIVVDVTGRLLTPKVTVGTDAGFQISQSDLLSYLVFGEPGFDIIGQTTRAVAGEGLVSSLFTPIATSYASEQLRQRLSWVDQFRFETANLDQATNTEGRNVFSRLITSSRLRAEKELGGNLYVGVSAGACGFKREIRETDAFGGFAGSLDWRLSSSLKRGSTLQFATEPSTVALLCSPTYAGSQGVAPTPRQYSLSFLQLWRW